MQSDTRRIRRSAPSGLPIIGCPAGRHAHEMGADIAAYRSISFHNSLPDWGDPRINDGAALYRCAFQSRCSVARRNLRQRLNEIVTSG